MDSSPLLKGCPLIYKAIPDSMAEEETRFIRLMGCSVG